MRKKSGDFPIVLILRTSPKKRGKRERKRKTRRGTAQSGHALSCRGRLQDKILFRIRPIAALVRPGQGAVLRRAGRGMTRRRWIFPTLKLKPIFKGWQLFVGVAGLPRATWSLTSGQCSEGFALSLLLRDSRPPSPAYFLPLLRCSFSGNSLKQASPFTAS